MQPAKKKKKLHIPSVKTFFCPTADIKPSASLQDNPSSSPIHVGNVDYISGCTLFEKCDQRFQYDIGLLVGKQKEISDGVKYQILTSRKYIPAGFKFPLNDANPPRQCNLNLLDAFEFLRYSPSMDGVFCVYCVLFSHEHASKKLLLLPERDWSNVLQVCTRHEAPPKAQSGAKGSTHLLSYQKAKSFIGVFERKQNPINLQLDEQRKVQVSNNRHMLVQIAKLLIDLGNKTLLSEERQMREAILAYFYTPRRSMIQSLVSI